MGVQNILGYLVWGYNILGGTKYPVTPEYDRVQAH